MTNRIPGVHLGTYGYEGLVELNAWHNASSGNKDAFRLSIDSDSIKSEQVAAYNYLIENQDEMKDVILQKLFAIYPEIQEEYGEYFDEDEMKDYLPNITQPEDMFHLITLSEIHIHDVIKDGIAYVGFQFNCTWEEEHGLGFMTYKKRIVAVGGADTSILSWIADDDKNKTIE